MGGGEKVPYNRKVWTPSGGWYIPEIPKNWKRNLFIMFGTYGLVVAGLFYISSDRERSYHSGFRPIPSQRWRTHTLDDDPQYPEKFANYKNSNRTLWHVIMGNNQRDYTKPLEDYSEEASHPNHNSHH